MTWTFQKGAGDDRADTRAALNDVYSRKEDTDVSWYEPEASVSLELIARSGLHSMHASSMWVQAPRAWSMAFSCRGHTSISVLDISEAALAKSRARLGEKASGVAWITSDVTAFKSEAPYAPLA